MRKLELFLSKIFGKKSNEIASPTVETVYLAVSCDNVMDRQELDFIISHYKGEGVRLGDTIILISAKNAYFNLGYEDREGIRPSKNHWIIKCPKHLNEKILLAINEFKASKKAIETPALNAA